MAYDEGLAQILRDDLAGENLREVKMFGGLCFMLDGNMLCGVHGEGGMFRVGKDSVTEALTVPGAAPMEMNGRKMGGLVDCGGAVIEDDARRGRLMGIALRFVRSLPPK